MTTSTDLESIPFALAARFATLIPDSESGDATEYYPFPNDIYVSALPNLKKETLSDTHCVVSPLGFTNAELDRGADYALYTISIAVTRNVSQTYNEVAGLVHFVERMQAAVADKDNRTFQITVNDVVHECVFVRRDFNSDPLFEPSLMRSEGIFLSVSVAAVKVIKDR